MPLKGWVTYLAAAGLLAVAGYQLFTGDTEAGLKTFGQAIALAGLRRAVSNVQSSADTAASK